MVENVKFKFKTFTPQNVYKGYFNDGTVTGSSGLFEINLFGSYALKSLVVQHILHK